MGNSCTGGLERIRHFDISTWDIASTTASVRTIIYSIDTIVESNLNLQFHLLIPRLVTWTNRHGRIGCCQRAKQGH
jgi:hypothetical protein